eukprot:6335818-Ditylum_brightwellii.AAC.1
MECGNMWQCGEQCIDENVENWVDRVAEVVGREEGGYLCPGTGMNLMGWDCWRHPALSTAHV